MYIILSPSKSQDFSRNFNLDLDFKKTEFLKETKEIHSVMNKISKDNLAKLMKISSKLAELNFSRFQNWSSSFNSRILRNEVYNFSPAIFAFTGDVYSGFDLKEWKKSDFQFAQKHLGIISGFYGLIGPLDYIKPYRLEMGTKISFTIKNKTFKNLYEFWEEKITGKISHILAKEKVLINLASVEYSKSIDRKKISANIIDIEFKIQKENKLSIIAIYAKKVRGQMANWIIKNRIEKVDDLKKFSDFGWKFSKRESNENKKVFIKKM